ncbi:MAG: zinc-ribbon domain-containing protein, partial [Desulfobacterales bacterium]
MKIICSKCNATYNIKENVIPRAKKMALECKKCGGRIVLQPGSNQTEKVSDAVLPPPVARTSQSTVDRQD